MKPKRRKRTIPTILSVDWDYFLPCDIACFDWGHGEGSWWSYEILWPLRANDRHLKLRKTAHELIRVDPARVAGFWDRVLGPNLPFRAIISDSHKDVVHAVETFDKVRIVNFDAHHDTGYGPERAALDCANWALKLRKSGTLVDYHLVYPEWRKQTPETHTKVPAEKITYGEWTGEPLPGVVVFLCRSSCWMPSWCDQEWLQLRAALLARKPICLVEAPYIKTARPFAPVEFPQLPQTGDHKIVVAPSSTFGRVVPTTEP